MSSLIPKCLRVPCPKCGAKIGDACKPAVLCHDERIALSTEDASQAAARIVREATEDKYTYLTAPCPAKWAVRVPLDLCRSFKLHHYRAVGSGLL
jgi:hypothetical protein